MTGSGQHLTRLEGCRTHSSSQTQGFISTGFRGHVSSLPPRALGSLNERGLLAGLQEPLRIQQAEELDQFGHDPGPAGLVAGASPAPLSPWKYS